MFGSRTSWSSGRYISTFRFPKDMNIFREPGRWNGKTESWRNTYRGVDLWKRRFVPGGFSCTNSPTSCTWRKVVDGYKRNIVSLPKHRIWISCVFATLMRPIVRNTECDPLVFKTPVGATHCFLQYLQFYQNPVDWMEGRTGNSNLDLETLFSDFQELLNGSGLRPVLTEQYWNWFSKASTLCQKVTFRGCGVRWK